MKIEEFVTEYIANQQATLGENCFFATRQECPKYTCRIKTEKCELYQRLTEKRIVKIKEILK